MTEEIWKPVVGFEESHKISDRGNIHSLNRVASSGKRVVGQPIKFFEDKDGYFRVTLRCNGREKKEHVHRTVLKAFVGIPEGMQVDHINMEVQDNRLENLRVVTPDENMQIRWDRLNKFADLQEYYYVYGEEKIVDFSEDSNFKISNRGYIIDTRDGSTRVAREHDRGYYIFSTIKNYKGRTYYAPKVMANHFLKDVYNFDNTIIRYKDGDTTNIKADNLYYAPMKYTKYAHLLNKE